NGIWRTPWEECPHRSASTRACATRSAYVAGASYARRTSPTNVRSACGSRLKGGCPSRRALVDWSYQNSTLETSGSGRGRLRSEFDTTEKPVARSLGERRRRGRHLVRDPERVHR